MNLAQAPTAEASKLITEMVALRDALEAAPDTVGDLGWTFGFRDPTGQNVDKCMGRELCFKFLCEKPRHRPRFVVGQN